MLQKYTNQDLTIPLYTCIKCRTILFDDTKIFTHEPGKHKIDSKRLLKDELIHNVACGCESYFVEEPLDWMSDTSETEGPIYCPKCKFHIGTYVWAGSQCSCGTWVTPSFKFPKSRVDKKEKVKIFRVDYRKMHENVTSQPDNQIQTEPPKEELSTENISTEIAKEE